MSIYKTVISPHIPLSTSSISREIVENQCGKLVWIFSGRDKKNESTFTANWKWIPLQEKWWVWFVNIDNVFLFSHNICFPNPSMDEIVFNWTNFIVLHTLTRRTCEMFFTFNKLQGKHISLNDIFQTSNIIYMCLAGQGFPFFFKSRALGNRHF